MLIIYSILLAGLAAAQVATRQAQGSFKELRSLPRLIQEY